MSPKIHDLKRSFENRDRGKTSAFVVFFCVPIFISGSLLLSGCGPKYTYPAGKVPESVERICKDEYKIDGVTARVVGKTVGAVFYINDIVDEKGQIPKEVHEQMGKVIQVVTRVALSTDLPLDFSSVIVRDKKQGNELTITRSIEDSKRANADAIGVEESINRTIFGQGHYRIGDAAKKNSFILKEVKMENFLAEQIVQRIRYNFSRDLRAVKNGKAPTEDEITSQPFVLVDGVYDAAAEKKGFRFSILSMKAEDPKETLLSVFKTINEVLAGYKYTAFDQIEVLDYLNRQKLLIDKQTLLDFQAKKIKEQDILNKCLTESQSIQEAFKLFGFTLPSESGDSKEVPSGIPTSPKSSP